MKEGSIISKEEHFGNVCRKVLAICSPLKIFLYSEKHTPSGQISTAKFCVIIPSGDSISLEEKMYMELDFDFPCDFLVYTKDEFDLLLSEKLSFATTIVISGRVLYEAD